MSFFSFANGKLKLFWDWRYSATTARSHCAEEEKTKSGDKQDVSVIWLWDGAGEQDSLFWAGSFLEQLAPNNRTVSNTKVEPGRGGTEPLIRGIKTAANHYLSN